MQLLLVHVLVSALLIAACGGSDVEGGRDPRSIGGGGLFKGQRRAEHLL